MFNTGIGTVHPAGRSPAQRNAARNTQNQRYRQQLIATRQIARNQQAPILVNPREDLRAVQRRQQQSAQAQKRANAIALQQVRMVQDQHPGNPYKAARILYGQAVSRLRSANHIGSLTKRAADRQLPLEHRVAALRQLRTQYGIPVTQQNFKAFRQAQKFHEFLHDGKEGDTITVPVTGRDRLGGKQTGLYRVSQTYQLRKQGNELVPVAVHPNKSLTIGGLLSGHPYRQHGYSRNLSLKESIAGQTGGIARGFTHAGIDTAHYGAKAIPEGKVGTPLRKAVTEIAALGPNTITGLYGLGAAGVAAAGGNTKPIRDIAHSFAEDDPLGRLLIHGDPSAFAAHPGIGAVELLGGAAAVDRIAGRAARGGRPAPLRSQRYAPNTRLGRQERYSKGYVVSRVQRTRDAKIDARFAAIRRDAEEQIALAKKAQERGDGDAASGHLKKARDLAVEAERFNRSRVREAFDTSSPNRTQLRGDLERLADVQEGTNQGAQRQTRAAAIREVAGKRAVREKNRKPGVIVGDETAAEVQGLIAEGRVAPHRGELKKLADRLERQAEHLTDHHEVATNRHLVDSIRTVLKTHSDDQLRLLGDEARRYAGVNVKAHETAKAAGLGTAEEFDMSAAKPFAVEQMGARPDAQGALRLARGATPEEVSRAIAAAEHTAAQVRSLRGQGSRADRSRLANAEAEAAAAQAHLDSIAPRLTLEQIHSAMHKYADRFPGALRPGEQAFISHSSKVRGGGVFNIRADTAKGLSRARRTGAAVIFGTASVGKDAMLGSVVKLHNMAQQVRSFRQMIADAAGRDPARHDPVTGKTGIIQEETAKAALAKWNENGTDPKTGLPKPGFVEGVAVRLNPIGGRAEQMAKTLHDVDEEGYLPGEQQQSLAKTFEEALQGKDVGEGPWTVIPKDYADRLIEHSKVSSGASPFFRTISQAFRKTVLPFSPTWLTGNAVESLGRGAVAGWKPGDTALEQRAIAEWAQMNPDRANRFLIAVGTGHMGSADMWKVRNTANSIKGPLRPIYRLAEKAANAKRGGKVVVKGSDWIRAYTDWMMNSVNATMESGIKRGLVGTQMRKMLPPDLPAKSEAAVKHIAGELHNNPAAVEELLTAVQRAYGTYEHFSPEFRRTIINYTPFGAWVFNAVAFLTRVLPADHPGLVALLAANDSATRQYRRENGLDATIAGEKDSGQVPPFLLGSIPTPAWYARLVGAEKGAPLRLARYTPFGIATDPTSTFASMFLPQLPLEVLQGYDFAGRPLRNKDGTPYDDSQLAASFGLNFAMGTIPLFGQLSRVIQRGPGALNPVQPVVRKQQSSSRSSGSSWMPSSGGSGNSWMPAASGSGNSWMP